MKKKYITEDNSIENNNAKNSILEETETEETQIEEAQTEDTAISKDTMKLAEEALANISENNPNIEIERLKKSNIEANDKLMRMAAECENIRKRSKKEIEEANKYSISNFARDLINVVENLYRALDHVSAEKKESNKDMADLADGVDMTLKTMITSMERQGIKRIYPEGELFNHNLHQAVSQIETTEYPVGTILNVMQAGYVIHDRLLQPAMVAVAKEICKSEEIQHIDTQA